MVRHVDIVVPHHYGNTVMEELDSCPSVFKITHFSTQDSLHINFKVRPKHLQDVVTRLSKIGCGEAYGTIDVFAVVMSRPAVVFKDNKPTKKAYAISDRMSIDEIQDLIEEGNHLTFDFLALMVMASLIAGAGLLGDNSTAVIASMLVSPMMGPILSMTFGLATMKFDIVLRGIRNEAWGVAMSLIVGIVMGLCASQVFDPEYRSHEMLSRGTVASLTLGLVVAAPSGMGVILAVSKGGFNAIVGTAISASLLPPVVNCGLCLALAFVHLYDDETKHNAYRFAHLGLMSFVLWIVNFVIIVIVGYLTFRFIKNVHPQNQYSTVLQSSQSGNSDWEDPLVLHTIDDDDDNSSNGSMKHLKHDYMGAYGSTRDNDLQYRKNDVITSPKLDESCDNKQFYIEKM
mmetsp:Transcript_2348/g.3604  ORF Transcript_2348/g.3604 Transcript_2348/m.3604 type:complete len:401 (-) Transcript_2348:35-1237(-)